MGQPNSPKEIPRMAVQFSVYPLRQEHLSPGVEAAVEAAKKSGVEVRVQNLSTLIHGPEEQVFAALRAAFRAARSEGDAILVATLSTGLPSDQRVAEIQQGSDS